MVKIDLQKAFDSVEWVFVEQILKEFGFPWKFISWIMSCITTVSFRIAINGKPSELFEGRKGLRQGDPLSPLLFVLSIEYLSRCLSKLKELKEFKYHPKCARLNITHLCFADDLLLFARGDMDSLKALTGVLDKFAKVSGLKVNPQKCEIYFGRDEK